MELPELGVQCSQPDCKQIDFLPLQCELCERKFCKHHVNGHLNECREKSQVAEPTVLKTFKGHKCDKCGTSSTVTMICDKCGGNFCIKHRHFDCLTKTFINNKTDNQLDVTRTFQEAKSNVDKIVQDNLNSAKKGKNRNMANKIQLMKIKNKATGLKTIPLDHRVYFAIMSSQGVQNKAVFVSRTWTIGRVIDAVAFQCQISNNNHKVGAEKLRLFKDDGQIICESASETLGNVLSSGCVIDGETLLLEFVSDDCNNIKPLM